MSGASRDAGARRSPPSPHVDPGPLGSPVLALTRIVPTALALTRIARRRYPLRVSRATRATLGRLIVVVAAGALIAACGSSAPTTSTGTTGSGPASTGVPSTGSGAPTQSVGQSSGPAAGGPSGAPATNASSVPVSSAPGSQPAGSASAEPVVTPTTAPTAPPPSSPTTPSSPLPSGLTPSPGASGAAGCTGSSENRDFYAAVAQAVTWPVYCAVLPSGWFLESGSYRLRNGGHLNVTYQGPGGASVVLQEGDYCTSGASACSPRDHELGPAAYGDMQGTLVGLGPNEPGDGYAVYVAPGQAPSWTVSATSVDQATFTGFAAALHRVGP